MSSPQDGRATLREIFAAARSGDLSAVELRLWLIVRSYDSGSGCYAATDTLAEYLGMSASHVEKRRASMVARGWLEVKHRGPLAPAVRAVVPAQALHSSEEQDPKALHLGLHSSANGVREYGKDKDTDGASQGPNGSPPPTRVACTPEFEAAWAAYPRRHRPDNKRSAFRAWQRLLQQGADAKVLIAAAGNYRATCEADKTADTKFVKQFATFLGKDDHWKDYLEPVSTKGTDVGNLQETTW
ncbi:MAG: helix-turn-helix domain-containing protein [Gemmatimonadota bacterium]